jgi:uncharacterized membrane protein
MAINLHSQRVIGWLSRRFFAGFFIVLPIAATIWIVQILYGLINGPLDQVIRHLVARHSVPGSEFFIANTDGTIPGAGFTLALLVFIVVGTLVGNFFGRQLMGWIDHLLLNLPVVKVIYNAFKQVVEALQDFGGDKPKFSRVCYVPMPGGPGHMLAFVTSDFEKPDGTKCSSVFLPSAPSPLTGLVIIYKTEDLVLAEFTVEQASKMIVSFGLVAPKFDAPDLGKH